MRRLVTLLLVIPLLGAVVAPAAAQSPTTTEELLAGMVTEEVEPGVYRVLDDDVVGMSADVLSVGPDGSVWLFGEDSFLRLGTEGPLSWNRDDASGGVDVAADGSVWMLDHFDSILSRFDGMTWMRAGPPDDVRLDSAQLVAVTADGSVWAGWWSLDGTQDILARWDGRDWQSVDQVVPCGLQGLHASDREIWYVSEDPASHSFREGCPATMVRAAPALYRYDGADWRREATPEGFMGNNMYGGNAVGPDGTIWVSIRRGDQTCGWCGRTAIARYDGGAWQEWTASDFPSEDRSNLVTGDFRFSNVSADGSLWGTVGAPDGCDGLVRFDGATATHYLEGLCIEWGAIDIGPDGTGWILGDQHELYAIRPAAMPPGNATGPSCEAACSVAQGASCQR